MTANTLFQQTIHSGKNSCRKYNRRHWYINAAILVLLSALFLSPDLAEADTYAVKQLAAFAKSRPQAGTILTDGKGVYEFLENAFAGLYTSVPLAWDPSEPNDNAYAEHKPSVNRKVINLRVSSLLSPLDQVACLVYESINAQNEKQFTEITEEAHKGFMTKSEFIRNILRLEHKSLKRTLGFLSSQEPYKNIDLTQNIFYSKMSGTPDDFDAFIEYLHQIKRDNYDVFEHYSNFYDFVIPPTRRWKANQRAAAAGQDAPPAPAEESH